MNRTKAFLTTLVILIIGVSIVLLFLYKPNKEVNVVRDVVIYTEDSPNANSAINTRIHVSGTLHRPLFRQHKFTGHISIDHYAFTRKNVMLDISITKEAQGIYMGGLSYQSSNDLEVGRAMIWFDEDFHHINIWTTPTWGEGASEPNMYIVTGEDFESAVNIQKAMREKFGDPFVPR